MTLLSTSLLAVALASLDRFFHFCTCKTVKRLYRNRVYLVLDRVCLHPDDCVAFRRLRAGYQVIDGPQPRTSVSVADAALRRQPAPNSLQVCTLQRLPLWLLLAVPFILYIPKPDGRSLRPVKKIRKEFCSGVDQNFLFIFHWADHLTELSLLFFYFSLFFNLHT